jgi:uncharacterized protein (DUF2384 family)
VTFRFRKAGATPRLSSAEQERQGRVVKLAQAALPSVEAVREFLNGFNRKLRARPLDLAITSEAGLEAVERAIVTESRRIRGTSG